jgi:hypothetical protein
LLDLTYDPLPPEPLPPAPLVPEPLVLPVVPVPDPVPLELEPLPGLEVEPLASPLLLLPLSDLFLSEQPGNAIQSNPDNMSAVSTGTCLLIVSSFRLGHTVTLTYKRRNGYAMAADDKILFYCAKPPRNVTWFELDALNQRVLRPNSAAFALVALMEWRAWETDVVDPVRDRDLVPGQGDEERILWVLSKQ